MTVEDTQNATPEIELIPPGTIIAQYRVVRKIGAGGMGEVYLAEDAKLERKVALKFLPLEFIHEKDRKERFLREARAAARLEHPNVVAIYEIGEFSGRPYYAMQFVDGQTLRDLIDTTSLKPSDILHIVKSVCFGLKAAHEKGIVHRDIKPANIIVSTEGTVRICDFGLAAVDADDKLTGLGMAVGTANYMSPEQAEGKAVDARSDIFSLGIVMYEMLTGVCPFVRGFVPATVHAIIYDEAKPLHVYNAELPDAWQFIIDRTLAKNSTSRYQSIKEVLADLETFANGEKTLPYSRSGTPFPQQFDNDLAVLYLRNLGEAHDEFLCYGLTEDIIMDLSRIRGIKVVPMRSVLKYKAGEADLQEIARSLGARTLLDGSLLKQGTKVRISAQLIDSANRNTIWADRWERDMADLPKIRKAIVDDFIRAFRKTDRAASLSDPGRPEAANPAAYEYYLRGRYAFEKKESRADVETAQGMFLKALELDPSLLPAKGGLAQVHIYNGAYDLARQTLEPAIADAHRHGPATEEAALLTLFGQVLARQSKYKEAKQHLQQAMSIARDQRDREREADAGIQLLILLRIIGKFEDGAAIFTALMEICSKLPDTTKSVTVLGHMGWLHLAEGNSEKARHVFNTALQMTRGLHDLHRQAYFLNSIAASYYGKLSEQSLRRELNYYLRAREIWEKVDDKRNMAGSACNVGLVYLRQAKLKEALPYFKKAAAGLEMIGEPAYVALFRSYEAKALEMLGDYAGCEAAADVAIQAARKSEQQGYWAQALVHKSGARFRLGDTSGAEALLDEALEKIKGSGVIWQAPAVWCKRGEIAFAQNQAERARESFSNALELAGKSGYEEFTLLTRGYLTALDAGGGNLEDARRRLKLLIEETSGTYVCYILRRLLGEVLLRFGSGNEVKLQGEEILIDLLKQVRQFAWADEAEAIQSVLDRIGK